MNERDPRVVIESNVGDALLSMARSFEKAFVPSGMMEQPKPQRRRMTRFGLCVSGMCSGFLIDNLTTHSFLAATIQAVILLALIAVSRERSAT